jgi:AraC-like DNA-binding protein
MSRRRQPGFGVAAEPESAIQVRPFAVGFSRAFAFPLAGSGWPGLIYASAGVMTVHAAGSTWVVPPERAVWMPAGVACRVEVSTGLQLRSLFFKPAIVRSLPRVCRVVHVPPLLRELVLHTTAIGLLNRTIPSHAHLIGVLRDQLHLLDAVPLQLPQPTDQRTRRIADRLAANPGATESLARLARGAGASARTIERLFLAETHMTFARWRQQLRLQQALRLLAAGEPVTTVALEVGYASPSAFVAMFRRAFGTTPSRYYRP